ncbi:hypothetical protein H2198_007104 [Neophaeococcomyces mojaviensis]|uniref:Uncharacterized protein n=1 Tax=Neophaeococcomyces mojaviensis TaxID=3383035 RepID=A0ACC3A1G1_9EURO|nr:hypothetical protein H2198_007104 [Knufia sp. JES_112]
MTMNGIHTNDEGQTGLKIIIVGAGIGGLSAAISLRKQGHDVVVFESSRFATELGAAIHVPPNAHGLLKRMGITPSQSGANPCNRVTTYAPNGRKLVSADTIAAGKIWQHEWVLGHRVKVHNALKETALKLGTQLNLANAVSEVNPEDGTVTLSDGSTHQADVVVGADGVHSVTRNTVVPGHPKPFSSGKSAFRFLIPKQAVLDDPQTRPYAEADGELAMVIGEDRRLVMYPTSDNTLLNFVCIHPENETSSASSGDWNNEATKDMLLTVYKNFHEDFLAILKKADEKSLKIWRLMDMAVLPSWARGRLALLGDAAHPFLPHQGQGAAVAMEDAAALGTVLERDLGRNEVQDRLLLYQDIRKSRADTLQEYTRTAGRDDAVGKVDMQKYMAFNFGHDEFDNAAQRLREWRWARQPTSYWRMPVAFGPMPGPRQTHGGESRDGTKSTFVTASIKIKTSRTVLQNLFPPGSKQWRFKSPGTVAYCSFSQTTLDGMEWLGGSGYNHLGLYIHGVEYVKADGSVTSGVYMPILFESLTDPIVSGREELGMPKLYSAIDVGRSANSYTITASWRGRTWGHFEWNDLQEDDISNVAGKMTGDDADNGILVQRYIPSVGRELKGQAEAEYTVFDDFGGAVPTPKPERTWSTKNARFLIDAGSWKTLPTLHHIITRLAEIPVYEVVVAKVVSGTGVPDVSEAVRI